MMTIWDYDGDGRVDAAVLAPGCLLSILFNRTLPARSRDADRDGILDVADPIAILRHFFFGGESPALGSRLRGDRRLPGAVPSMTGARAAILALCALAALPQLPGQDDCNQNGVDDAQDIAAGTSRDCNGNGVPDECDLAPTHLQFQPRRRSRVVTQPREFLEELVPGDFDGDGRIDLVVEVNGL